MATPADAFLLSAVRTPYGRYRGGLSGIRADDLAALPLAELVARHPDLDPASIDDVVYGNANGAGEDNRNVARMAVLLAGLPVTVPGVSINRLCGSGGEALIGAARDVRAGDASLVVAGGVEGMSRAPYVLAKPEEALPRSMRLEQTTVGWRLVNPKFPARWTDPLGTCAERVAEDLGIGREEQDEWAARSHQRAHAAWDEGHHDDYVMKVEGVLRDESIRPDCTPASLAGLKPAYTPHGSVTAGNSSPLSDGAIAAFVGSAEAAERLGVAPLGRIVTAATAAVEPDRFSVAPVPAVRKALAKAGLRAEQVDLWEINEAFAAMVLSTLHGLPEVDPERVNVNGGAIAIGHPLGASAPRVIVDLCRELHRRGGGIGVGCACIGVGQGQAVIVEVTG